MLGFADPGARELRARLAKVNALALILIRFKIAAVDAEAMDENDWRTAAKCAGVNPPHSEVTRQMILDKLRSVEPRMTINEFRRRLAALELKTRPTKKGPRK